MRVAEAQPGMDSFMAVTSPFPSIAAEKQTGFDTWMERALEHADAVHKDWRPAAVHDLRVALRRCRTMAQALGQIAPDASWRKVKKESRELFDALGELRDTQVERRWVKRLAPAGEAVRRHMLRVLSRRERKRRTQAARALDRFDAKAWRKLARKLAPEAEQFQREHVEFERLAVERLNDVVELYRRARKGRSRVAWHRLRIALKRFRYIVENFLPQRYAAWGRELKHIQDSLGDVHDLDVLRSEVRLRSNGIEESALVALLTKIENERTQRLDEFRARVSGAKSPWDTWRAKLPIGAMPKVTPGLARAASSAG
ncbi:MAG: CHAD domain-containing protein [Candidatus Acidiferrales bacterium]